MKIHFVCTGNVFRSRLAEAYLCSLELAGIEVSSSGTEAEEGLHGSICDYTKDALKKDSILQYVSKHWVITTKELLESQDLVIFMRQVHYDFCLNELGARIKNFKIWDIFDLGEAKIEKWPSLSQEEIVTKIYQEIKQNIDTLVKDLKIN